jgi:ABC-type phosphate transport system substrate-binding protein
MFTKKTLICGLIAMMSGATGTAAYAEVVIVVSAKNAATTISSDQASDIFLGKSTTLPGGGAIVAIDQADGSTVREEFYSKAVGKTPAQVKAYWSKQIFSGKGHPPKEAGDSAIIKGLVAGDPNLIGYIDKGALDTTVKSLLIVK